MSRVLTLWAALVFCSTSVFAQGAFRLTSPDAAEGGTINASQALAGFTINASKVGTASFTALFGR